MKKKLALILPLLIATSTYAFSGNKSNSQNSFKFVYDVFSDYLEVSGSDIKNPLERTDGKEIHPILLDCLYNEACSEQLKEMFIQQSQPQPEQQQSKRDTKKNAAKTKY